MGERYCVPNKVEHDLKGTKRFNNFYYYLCINNITFKEAAEKGTYYPNLEDYYWPPLRWSNTKFYIWGPRKIWKTNILQLYKHNTGWFSIKELQLQNKVLQREGSRLIYNTSLWRTYKYKTNGLACCMLKSVISLGSKLYYFRRRKIKRTLPLYH